MKRLQKPLTSSILGFFLLLALLSGCANPVAASTTTPVEHTIVVMQENHSFDNYFGKFPGADGIPLDACMPVKPATQASSVCVKPFHLEQYATENLPHNATIFRQQYRAGRMTGFISAHQDAGKDGSLAMGYYDGEDLPVYWNLAADYVLFDRFFSSAAGGSIRNYMFWVTATPGGTRDVIPTEGWGDLPTIFDRLEDRGISWKFYVQNYDPAGTLRAGGRDNPQLARVPLLSYARYVDDPKLARHVVDLQQYFQDLRDGTLPAVAYVATSTSSEHPPSNILAGQRLVRSLITELMRSSAWPTSAFILTYSNWGGWYDHVPPPRVDQDGYGFRVPALLISPYARQGHIESSQLDYTSILKFIEDNYGLAPLSTRDAAANSIAPAFDFAQAPREPSLVYAQTGAAPRPEPRRAGIYAAYGMALALPTLIILWASFSTRRSRRSLTLLLGPTMKDEA